MVDPTCFRMTWQLLSTPRVVYKMQLPGLKVVLHCEGITLHICATGGRRVRIASDVEDLRSNSRPSLFESWLLLFPQGPDLALHLRA